MIEYCFLAVIAALAICALIAWSVNMVSDKVNDVDPGS